MKKQNRWTTPAVVLIAATAQTFAAGPMALFIDHFARPNTDDDGYAQEAFVSTTTGNGVVRNAPLYQPDPAVPDLLGGARKISAVRETSSGVPGGYGTVSASVGRLGDNFQIEESVTAEGYGLVRWDAGTGDLNWNGTVFYEFQLQEIQHDQDTDITLTFNSAAGSASKTVSSTQNGVMYSLSVLKTDLTVTGTMNWTHVTSITLKIDPKVWGGDYQTGALYAVPEPGHLGLIGGFGLAGFACYRRWRRS
jgi:hypothetical protein